MVKGSGEKIKDLLIPNCLITSFDFPSCIGGCPSASPGPPWPSCQKQEEETGPIAAIPGAGSDPDWGKLSAEPWEPLPATCTCGQWVGALLPTQSTNASPSPTIPS